MAAAIRAPISRIASRSDGSKRPRVDRAQKLWLELHGHGPDLVQEQHAAHRELARAGAPRACSRERAFFVSEERRFEEARWMAGAVERLKRLIGRRSAVQGMRDSLFTRSARSDDEDGSVGAFTNLAIC